MRKKDFNCLSRVPLNLKNEWQEIADYFASCVDRETTTRKQVFKPQKKENELKKKAEYFGLKNWQKICRLKKMASNLPINFSFK